MSVRTLASGLGTATVAATLVVGIPRPASAQSVTGPENFTVIVAGSAPQRFIAQGVLTTVGTAVPVISNGMNGGVDQVQLRGGTFALDLQNTSGTGSSMNPVTCIATFSGAGTSTISGGTGEFADIAGSGTFTFHGMFIATRTPQGCSQQGTVLDIVRDQGILTLP